ncbi:MAG: hypothetical protein U0744_21410 [Gemmataceae bacterium]
MHRLLGTLLLLVAVSFAFAQTGDERPATKDPAAAADSGERKVGSKKTQTFDMAELEKKTFFLTFPANQRAFVRVTSEMDTDIDLYLDDLEGREITNDVGEPKDCEIAFTPLKEKIYRVSLINIGPGSNRCKFEHSGSEAEIDFGKVVELKPMDIEENKQKDIDCKWEAGQLAYIWVGADKASDVDVHVFGTDDKEIAKDEQFCKDSTVTFRVPKTGNYRIEVRNLGPGPNRCVMKHTESKSGPVEPRTKDAKKTVQ